jgi:hypothetical protein
MAEHDARVPPTPRVSEGADATLFPGRFVAWNELTRDEVAAFANALDGARDEHDMQRFLEANPRILIQHLIGGRGAWVIPKQRLGSQHETDFAIVQQASGNFVWYAVELERPQAKIFNKNGDPSAALTHALRQISDWRDWLSQNRDYAARSRERSGLGLIDIDPELEGLIVIGRNSDLEQGTTTSRRRRLERIHRIRIEPYDWLLSQAHERLEVLGKRANPLGGLIGTILSTPLPDKPANKAVKDVFGGTWSGWANASLVRGEIEWEGVEIWPDPDFGEYVTAPVQIIYAEGTPENVLLQPADWKEWIDDVRRNLDARYSLLVTELAPAGSLQEVLTLERDGTWYVSDWYERHNERCLWRLDILVYLPPAISYDKKRSRVAVARELLQRYIPHPAVERRKAAEREREAELKVTSLSLAPGDTVTHATFGLGIVISASGSGTKAEAVIDFGAGGGTKYLATAYAPLQKLR